MRAKFRAFPAIHLHAYCTEHNCHVYLNIEESKPFQSHLVVGAQISSLKCHLGGWPAQSCESAWVITASAPGAIIIEP